MAFLLSPIGRVVLVLCLILAGLLGIYAKGRSDGKQKTIETINQQTSEAFDAALAAARTVDACYALDSGLRWNISRAKCERNP
jgi:uncharacterized protein (UPF0333 family)